MNLKTLVAASAIALLPATSFAAITVNTEGVNGVQLNALSGSDASTGDVLGGTTGLLLGPSQSLDWNMRVINDNGIADSDGTATYQFTVLEDASISLTSTQNPFAGLDNLALSLTVGAGTPNTASYGFGAFAALTNISVSAFETFTVQSSWTGISGLFTEIDVDFVLSAELDQGGTEIPLPATAFLLLGALGGLGFVARKRS